MIINLKIVRVNTDYCDYLRKFDNKVSYNKFEKESKPKHKNMKNTIDFFKIKDGELGAVNFNNMIPVNENNYSLVDLNKETLTIAELKYQKLLREQLEWLNANYKQIKSKSLKLYQLYTNGKLPENIRKRCCNFKLLEEKCVEYNKS